MHHLTILVAIIRLASFKTFALPAGFYQITSSLNPPTTFKKVWGSSPNCRGNFLHYRIQWSSTTLSESSPGIEPTPLCDLQTFLRLCNLVDSGGEAKTVIQDSKCLLNGIIETRRSKKLFAGDKVSYLSTKDLDVTTVVEEKGYVNKIKAKKDKPLQKLDENVEFGGRYRREEWREERKLKKTARKIKNQKGRN